MRAPRSQGMATDSLYVTHGRPHCDAQACSTRNRPCGSCTTFSALAGLSALRRQARRWSTSHGARPRPLPLGVAGARLRCIGRMGRCGRAGSAAGGRGGRAAGGHAGGGFEAQFLPGVPKRGQPGDGLGMFPPFCAPAELAAEGAAEHGQKLIGHPLGDGGIHRLAWLLFPWLRLARVDRLADVRHLVGVSWRGGHARYPAEVDGATSPAAAAVQPAAAGGAGAREAGTGTGRSAARRFG